MSVPETAVKIHVKTTITHENSMETLESKTVGHFYKKDHSVFLKYEERTDQGNIRTIVKAAREEALILRSGAIKMRLPFTLDMERIGHYELPIGKFETSTFAKKIDHFYQAESGKGYIAITYDFSLQGSEAGTYELQIIFQEEEQ